MLSQESSGAMSFPGAEINSSHAVSGLEVSVVMFEASLTSEHPNKKIEHNMDPRDMFAPAFGDIIA